MRKNIKRMLTIGVVIGVMNSSIIPVFAAETTENLNVLSSSQVSGSAVSTGNNSTVYYLYNCIFIIYIVNIRLSRNNISLKIYKLVLL
jgi:hypothetical protein